METVTLADVRSALAQLVGRIDHAGREMSAADLAAMRAEVIQLRRALREVRDYDSTPPVTRAHLDELDRSFGRILLAIPLGSALPTGADADAAVHAHPGDGARVRAYAEALALARRLDIGDSVTVSGDGQPDIMVVRPGTHVGGEAGDRALLAAMRDVAETLGVQVACRERHDGNVSLYVTAALPSGSAARLWCLIDQPGVLTEARRLYGAADEAAGCVHRHVTHGCKEIGNGKHRFSIYWPHTLDESPPLG